MDRRTFLKNLGMGLAIASVSPKLIFDLGANSKLYRPQLGFYTMLRKNDIIDVERSLFTIKKFIYTEADVVQIRKELLLANPGILRIMDSHITDVILDRRGLISTRTREIKYNVKFPHENQYIL